MSETSRQARFYKRLIEDERLAMASSAETLDVDRVFFVTIA